MPEVEKYRTEKIVNKGFPDIWLFSRLICRRFPYQETLILLLEATYQPLFNYPDTFPIMSQ
jgi:hypothetical protein